MAKNQCAGAPRHCDAIKHGANWHDRKVSMFPVVNWSAPNNGYVEGKIGERA